jgi:glutamate racemase
VDDRPIGMFDSGFGGLTVARAVMDLLPGEDLVYLGDTARYPYGPRPLEEVAGFAHQIAAELVERREVKLLVVACNTAAAAALDTLSASLDVPVVGVIEPGTRAVLSATVTGRVGVIGTVGTIDSGAYQRAVAALLARGEAAAPEDHEVDLHALACPGFVEFVERGEFDGPQVRVLAERLLAPAVVAKVDTLLLGCTHYPYLARTIGDVMGRDVVMVSSADETAFEVRRLLHSCDLQSGMRRAAPQATFVTTGDVNRFEELGRRLLGPELARAERIRWP